MWKGLLGMGLTAALAWAAGCGGKVVVDGISGQGGGAGGPTTTTSGGAESRCSVMCTFLGSAGCTDTTTCAGDCLELYEISAGCVPQLDAYLDCLIDNFSPDCAPPFSCLAPAEAYATCLGGIDPGPGPSPGCSGDIDCFAASDGSCGCKGLCSGIEASIECAPGPSGTFDCLCFADGAQVGSCQEASQTCDIQSGCCAPYIFGFGED